MTTGNGMPTAFDSSEDMPARDRSRQLRDIEELVAKLRIVTKQLSSRAGPAERSAPAHATTQAQASRQAQPPVRGARGGGADEAGLGLGERK